MSATEKPEDTGPGSMERPFLMFNPSGGGIGQYFIAEFDSEDDLDPPELPQTPDEVEHDRGMRHGLDGIAQDCRGNAYLAGWREGRERRNNDGRRKGARRAK